MKQKKLLLRIAAFLVFLTFAGHTFGHFKPMYIEQPETLKVIEMMSQTVVPMPIGSNKSLNDFYQGSSLCLSAFLLMCGMLLAILSNAKESPIDRQITAVLSFGLGSIAVLSAIYFFPVPAFCTGVAAILTIVSSRL